MCGVDTFECPAALVLRCFQFKRALAFRRTASIFSRLRYFPIFTITARSAACNTNFLVRSYHAARESIIESQIVYVG